jgi:hypothetical protein
MDVDIISIKENRRCLRMCQALLPTTRNNRRHAVCDTRLDTSGYCSFKPVWTVRFVDKLVERIKGCFAIAIEVLREEQMP